MKEYLIVYSYVEENYNFDNDRDCILSHLPHINNEKVEAKNKKDAMNDFLEYRDYRYKIINIIDLESEVN